jgi:hypothetical protein
MPPDSTTFLQLLLDPQQWTPVTIFTAIGAVANEITRRCFCKRSRLRINSE